MMKYLLASFIAIFLLSCHSNKNESLSKTTFRIINIEKSRHHFTKKSTLENILKLFGKPPINIKGKKEIRYFTYICQYQDYDDAWLCLSFKNNQLISAEVQNPKIIYLSLVVTKKPIKHAENPILEHLFPKQKYSK